MTALFGGIVALVLGVVLLLAWWQFFLHILQGSIPLLLLAGGVLATYLGIEEVRERIEASPAERGGPEEAERYRREAEHYRQELDILRQEIERLRGRGVALEDQKNGLT
ncbi:MAG: hypothetical protein V2A77_06100 [Pseudomonadota bacterium]